LAVLEAQASGLPAIVADRGAPAEVVRRHQSGLLVNLEMPGALADAMQRLVEDPELHTRLLRAALRNAQESSWDRVAERIWAPQAEEATSSPAVAYQAIPMESTEGLIVMDVA
jgi:glycosyltransferase involved in cell wall biosynthesis